MTLSVCDATSIIAVALISNPVVNDDVTDLANGREV
jgi:hypothetical protein